MRVFLGIVAGFLMGAVLPSIAGTMSVSELYPVQAPTSTIGALPACSTSLRGVGFIVTDALTPVALATVSAGGAVVVPVVCNGTNWIVG